MTKVNRGKTMELVDHWGGFCNVKISALTEGELDCNSLPALTFVPHFRERSGIQGRFVSFLQ